MQYMTKFPKHGLDKYRSSGIEKKLEEEDLDFVRPCSPGARLSNWESVDVPMVFSSDEV